MKAHLVTYGCQMNEYDTHVVESQLVALGVELVKAVDEADFVLVNTCAVRGKPVDKVRAVLGNLRRVKRERGLLIGMMGCLAQLEEGQEIAKKFDVDILLGPGALLDIGTALEGNKRFWSMAFKDDLHDFVPPAPQHKLSAHLTIQRGCDHHCTYCIVPETRGPQVSRHPDLILQELDSLVAAGALEVTLLGQNVNSYGKDQQGYPDFGDLLRQVGQSGIPRVKFTTSHPMDFSDNIIQAIAETPNVCKYIHLPVQSGSNKVLKAMGREYTREWYLERIEKMRSLIPNLYITTDFIVGFPNETESDFLETISLYDTVQYDAAFMYIYSARPGTPSYKHFKDLPKEVKSERIGRLVDRQKHWSQLKYSSLIGQEVECLIRGQAFEPSFSEGHTEGNHAIFLPFAQAPVPGIYKAKVDHATPHQLFGQVTEIVKQADFMPMQLHDQSVVHSSNLMI